MSSKSAVWSIGVIAAVAVAGFALVHGFAGPGMMFGSGGYDRPVYPGWGGGVLGYDQAIAYVTKGNDIGVADPARNTVEYSGKDIEIDLVAVEPDHADQTFEVHDLTNPALEVPLGATVHLNLVNMDYGDTMEHGITLTSVPPPYSNMSMMTTGTGIAQVAPLLPWRSSKSVDQAQYASLGTTFVAREAGTYWYICPTPRHAAQGMYGKFIVR